jgi:diguanylate cyclase (GGDEF)-like protein
VTNVFKRKIFLVDDDPLIRRVVTKSLVDIGYQVFSTGSPLQVLFDVRTQLPDLILLDVMMPELSGYEVCQQLRNDPQTATIPIIMLTAMDEPEAIVKGLKTGADDYITKPFNIDELVSRIEAHLRRSAREIGANPLTTLPGNPTIEQVLQTRLDRHEPLAVLYVDLTNFKPYNDEYGWYKGDQVIKMLAQKILEAVNLHGGKNGFVGHIGGDDFVIMTAPACAESVAQALTASFDAAIPAYYSEDDRARGYINVLDRRGKRYRAPVVSISIAIVTNNQRSFAHVAQVSTWAAEVKKYVKSLPGSHYAFDRRSK